MIPDDEDTMKNAAEIIERFGGIRPMAAKVGAPVTTVQGWKKRDVIPAARRDDVLKAANENDIDLSDLMEGTNSASSPRPAMPSMFKPSPIEPKSSLGNDNVKITVEPLLRSPQKSDAPRMNARIDATHEELMAAIDRGQKKAVNTSLWTAGIFTLLIAGASFLALVPTAKQVQEQGNKIATLENKMDGIDQDVQEMNAATTFFKDMIPENMQTRMQDLKNQANAISNDVQTATKLAQDITKNVLASDAGSLSNRLSMLETKLGEIEGGQALKDLMARVRGLEASIGGQAQLTASIAELRTIVDSLDGQVGTLGEKMTQSQTQPNSALGQTLDGVSGSDMKAAAMLIAFSQLRESLNRNEPFANDLTLLQKLVGNDDPALQEALSRLAPQAQKGGVLTSQGLSQEFKGLAGDIVFSSLEGENVSVTEKAKMRLTQAMNIKKDGELVGGTDTQKAVVRAQSQLDAGDVQGAIATLKQLDGSAATTAAPFLEQAQATLLADNVQNMLRQMIVGSVGGTATPSSGMIEKIKDTAVQAGAAITGGNVVKDEESGLVILPKPKGFMGFSQGTTE